MPRILCALPARTWERIMTAELATELEELGEVVPCPQPEVLSESEYAALWLAADAVLTGWGVRPPDAQTVERLERLRIVAHAAGSVRTLPRRLLERGIVVTTARSAIARTVAEYCLLSAILLLRRHCEHLGRASAADAPASETLFGKPVGLVGFGCVGRCFRDLLRPFDCPVRVHDPWLSPVEAEAAGVIPCGLGETLGKSRVVSLHAPDIPETRGMIGTRQLGLLQDGAVLINSARGRLVDTAALTEELASGRIRAALDVTDPEPLPLDHALRRLPNVLLTPHIAGPTTDDLPELARLAITEIRRCLAGEVPLHPMSLEAYDRMSF